MNKRADILFSSRYNLMTEFSSKKFAELKKYSLPLQPHFKGIYIGHNY
jgi:hypothetical protein